MAQCSQDAVIVEFEIEVDSVGNVSIDTPSVIPTWVAKDNGWIIRDVGAELACADLDEARRSVLRASSTAPQQSSVTTSPECHLGPGALASVR